MDPKTSLAKIGDKIMSTTIELTIRQLLTLALDLFEYVCNYTTEHEAPPDKEILVQDQPVVQKATTAPIAVDRQMPVIQLQIGRNLVDNVLLDGGSGVNIMSEDLRRKLGLPKSNPLPYNLRMADSSGFQPVGLFRDLVINIQGIQYIVSITVMKMEELDPAYLLLLG